MKEVIKIQDLHKSYGKEEVLKGINISLEKGKVYGLIGPNGAGKSTLFKVLSGLTGFDSGEIIINGSSDITLERKKISFMIEQPYMDNDLSARENLELVSYIRNVSDDNFDKVLSCVGLGEVGKKKTGKFSVGMKQRLGIAMALVSKPDILVLDEPINGLDPIGVRDIRELLKKLNSELGVTIVISSHILSELENIASDYIMINKGQIIDEISSEKIKKHGNVEEYFMDKVGVLDD